MLSMCSRCSKSIHAGCIPMSPRVCICLSCQELVSNPGIEPLGPLFFRRLGCRREIKEIVIASPVSSESVLHFTQYLVLFLAFLNLFSESSRESPVDERCSGNWSKGNRYALLRIRFLQELHLPFSRLQKSGDLWADSRSHREFLSRRLTQGRYWWRSQR